MNPAPSKRRLNRPLAATIAALRKLAAEQPLVQAAEVVRLSLRKPGLIWTD